jgi:hypothetical protein
VRHAEEDEMSTTDPQDDEALRAEIQAAIAAGRELGPDMDRHIADSTLERYRKERAAREKAVATPAPQQAVAPHGDGAALVARTFTSLAGLAAIVAIVVLQPHFFWVIFFLPAIVGWWGGWGHWNGHHHGPSHSEMRATYRRLRMERMQQEMRRLRVGHTDWA